MQRYGQRNHLRCDPKSQASLKHQYQILMNGIKGNEALSRCSITKIAIAIMSILASSAFPALAQTLDVSKFSPAGLAADPETVECTLENGAAAKCTKFILKYLPDNLKIGPFCPTSLNDTGGIWAWDGEKPGLYRLDRAFFEMLNGIGYTFYDKDEKIHIALPVGGRPQYDHVCLQMVPNATVTMTVLLPNEPVMAAKPSELGTVAKVGLALDGVPIFADAPSVLQTGHLPALDTCGGHIDPGGWYHWHADALDMATVYAKAGVTAQCGQPQSSSAQFAYAFDGIAIFGNSDENGVVPTDLDECSGHMGLVPGSMTAQYHYHAPATFPNLPKCLKGLSAKANFVTTASAGIGSQRGFPVFTALAAALILLLAATVFVFWRRRKSGV